MRILFVVEHYAPYIGGAEVLFQHLCEGLARDHDVTVVTSRLEGTESYEVRDGVRVYRVNVPRKGGRYWFTLLSIPRIFQAARGTSLIHTTTYAAAPAAWLISKFRRKKCVITVHEALGSQWMNLTRLGYLTRVLYRLLERVILLLPFDRILCVSECTYESLRKMDTKTGRIRVIHSGIEYSLFDSSKMDGMSIRAKMKLEDKFVYMYYGRPGVTRGVEYLIQAVPLIAREIPNSALLLILSRHPARQYKFIKKLIEDLNVGERILLLDPVPRDELPYYIGASDCVVIPSLSEGFGFSAAEACAMGKPVIASRVGSLPEVVWGKRILIEPGNPQEIAGAVRKASKGQFEYVGRKEFRWEECLKRHKEVYTELLGVIK